MREASPTGRWLLWSRPALHLLAVVFTSCTLLYTILWMTAVRWTPEVELGFKNSSSLVITDVVKGSPAETAGLLRGDRVLAINGNPVEDGPSLYREYRPHKPGDRVQVTVARPGQ